MQRKSTWVVRSSTEAGVARAQSEHVMAWARDVDTGEPIYILELDQSRTASNCRCECPSCNLPLTAVNAAKTEYIRRPHFRHPDGAEKSECMFLAARLVALQLLREQGFLLLPSRNVRGTVTGISGTEHGAWIVHPSESVKICNFNFQDRTAAILTLEDGRKLRVQLVGTVQDGLGQSNIPTILLELADSTLASMSLDDLRSRITLVPDSSCWLSHWNDSELLAEARLEAAQIASDFLDLESEHADELKGVEAKFRRETVLHLEVKKILAETRKLRVPELFVEVDNPTGLTPQFECEWTKPSEFLTLLSVELERRTGHLIPDVVAKLDDGHESLLLVEVTVTNQIGPTRLAHLRDLNVLALEIDLSRAGGLIKRSELRELVVNGLETKRWLHHPEQEWRKEELANHVELVTRIQLEKIALEDARRKRVMELPIEDLAQEYLDRVLEYAEFDAIELPTKETLEQSGIARSNVIIAADDLAIRGYPEALDLILFDGRQGIISRLLSIKLGRGVGYRLSTTMDVMNAIKQSSARNSSNHSIYLIAERVYRNPYSPRADWFPGWVSMIRDSIENAEATYVRSTKYDRLISMLFPEMANGLANGYGSVARRVTNPAPLTQATQRPAPPAAIHHYFDTSVDDAWLNGRDLLRWELQNPAAAKDFKKK